MIWELGRRDTELYERIVKAHKAGRFQEADRLRNERTRLLAEHPPWNGKSSPSIESMERRLTKVEAELGLADV